MAYICTNMRQALALLDMHTYNDPSVPGFTPESNSLHNEMAVAAGGAAEGFHLSQGFTVRYRRHGVLVLYSCISVRFT